MVIWPSYLVASCNIKDIGISQDQLLNSTARFYHNEEDQYVVSGNLDWNDGYIYVQSTSRCWKKANYVQDAQPRSSEANHKRCWSVHGEDTEPQSATKGCANVCEY